jgi:hypothetical protein
MNLHINAIAPHELDRLRRQGHDGHGNALQPFEDPEGGAPLRCCLRESRPGERIALIAHAPLRLSGPYWELGPVFVHADPCEGYATPAEYPGEFRDRTQVLRAYSGDQRILGGTVVAPDEDQDAAVEALLADPAVELIHARNPVFGCYMFEITRALPE